VSSTELDLVISRLRGLLANGRTTQRIRHATSREARPVHPLGSASVAYACTALATLSTNTSSAVAGAPVTVSGKFFAPHDPSDIRTSPAIVHLDRVDGPALATASPSSTSDGGTFNVTITLPAVDPGDHVIIVTQNGIDGRPAYGTPARVILTVLPTPVVPAPVAQVPVPALPTVPAPLADVPAAALAPVKALTHPKTLAQRISTCRSKYKLVSAKTKKGRKNMAAKRAACIRAARLTS
jgi:hypothetical protein